MSQWWACHRNPLLVSMKTSQPSHDRCLLLVGRLAGKRIVIYSASEIIMRWSMAPRVSQTLCFCGRQTLLVVKDALKNRQNVTSAKPITSLNSLAERVLIDHERLWNWMTPWPKLRLSSNRELDCIVDAENELILYRIHII